MTRYARLYTETFAAALMLLMNRDDSPGLLVRPRPGRAELCGEFTGSQALCRGSGLRGGEARERSAPRQFAGAAPGPCCRRGSPSSCFPQSTRLVCRPPCVRS